MDTPEEADELIEGIYQGEIQPSLGLNSRTDFKPWLKPRKHYIRLNQWCLQTRVLIEKLQVDEGGELRYLGLPGEDLLDVRVLKGVCERAKVTLRYLGFDSSIRSAQLNLSRHEVNSEKFIHSSSRVIGDRLEALGFVDSTAYQIASNHAPFDVINLDLCNSLTTSAAEGKIPNLEALRTLCDIQIQRQGQPWLLFVTTRTLRDGLDKATKRRLFDCLLKNIGNSVDFRAILEKELELIELLLLKEVEEASLGDVQWFNAYVVGVSKWLLQYMMANDYAVSVKLLPSYGYSVDGGIRDMVSLAFLLEPLRTSRDDETRLTMPRPRHVLLNEECQLARAIIEEIAKIKDVDDILKGNPPLKEKMFEKCSRLLAPLRYDMEAYKKFAFAD